MAPYVIVVLMVAELWLAYSVAYGKIGDGLEWPVRRRESVLWAGLGLMIATSMAYIAFGGR